MFKFDLVAKIVLSPLPERFTQGQGQILLPSDGVDLPSRPRRYLYKVVTGLSQPLHHRKVAFLSGSQAVCILGESRLWYVERSTILTARGEDRCKMHTKVFINPNWIRWIILWRIAGEGALWSWSLWWSPTAGRECTWPSVMQGLLAFGRLMCSLVLERYECQ